MLTIGQLAAYAGVTARAVRHYHQTGLLPEPPRDHSGYRSYNAQAVVDLIRIRTLADAGVPLSLILLAARWPDRIGRFMADKTAQLDDPRTVLLYRLIGESLQGVMEDDRLVEMADLIAELAEQSAENGHLADQDELLGDDAFVALIDSFAEGSHPMVERLQELLAERGWTGWTRIERAEGGISPARR